MNKRGVTQHIEMILATVLFVAFFFFIFLFVKPYDTDVLSESLVDGLKYNLDNSVGTEVVHWFVYVTESIEKESFLVNLPSHIKDEVLSVDAVGCKAFDLTEKSYNCELQNSNQIYIHSEEIGSYNVLLSSQIDEYVEIGASGNPSVSTGGDFTQEVYSYNLLVNLKETYEKSYDSLKEEWGFPKSYDFTLTSGIINLTREIPRDVEVLGKEFVEEVLYPNGTIINERFLVKIW